MRINVPLNLDKPLKLTDGTFDIPGDFYLTSEGSQYYTFPYSQTWTVRQGSPGSYQQLYHVDGDGGMTVATNSVSDITVSAGAALWLYGDAINLDANLDDKSEQTAINLKQNGNIKFRITQSGVTESIAQVGQLRSFQFFWCRKRKAQGNKAFASQHRS